MRRQNHVGSRFALLTPRDREFCVAGTRARKQAFDVGRLKQLHDVDEWPTRANRRQLARIADEHEPLYVVEGIDECGELLLGQHGALVHDHRPVVAAARGPRFRKIGACCAVVPLEPVQELGECQAGPAQPGLRFEAYARLAGRGEEQQSLGGDVGQRAEHPQKRCLPSSRRADEDGKPRPDELLQCSRLFLAGAHLQFAVCGVLRKRLIKARVDKVTPIEVGSVRLALFPSAYLATNDLAALDKPVDLVSGFALAGGCVRDDGAEVLLRCVEHILAERTWRLQFPLPGATDNPASRQQRVPLRRALL